MRVSKAAKIIILTVLIFFIFSIVLEPPSLSAGFWSRIKKFFKQVIDFVVDIFTNPIETITTIIESTINTIKFSTEFIVNLVKLAAAKVVGDPVLVTSGQYLLEEKSIEIPESIFTISRIYLSEETVIGSFGRGWLTSIDSRIIRGNTKLPKDLTNQLHKEFGEAKNLREEMALVAGGLDEEALEDLPILKNILDFIGEEDDGYDYDKDDDYLEISKEMAELLSETEEGFNEMEQRYQEILKIEEEAEELGKLNQFVQFEGTPKEYEEIGNQNLLLIDERGTPILFEPSGLGTWLPSNSQPYPKMSLRSRDGRSAITKAGFILTDAGGIKKYYNADGLLEAVEELNGNRIDLTRNAQGRVTKISGPHNNEWTVNYSADGFISAIVDPLGRKAFYQYSGKYLTMATDMEGVAVNYTYADERLKKVIKADGSFIELTYGMEKDGKKMITSTTHEEGASEKFDYFQGYTVHTNHSGVATVYRYNDDHQVTREEHADGSVKTFNYNSKGQLERESKNGFETRYSYDARENITQKSYNDGTSESWLWNGNDQLLRQVDRDGVVTEWTYDAGGNCTSIKKGNETIFTGVYGERGKILESREGNRAARRYTYDKNDFLTSISIDINGQTITEKFEYDALGRILKSTDGEGRIWSFEYGQGVVKTYKSEGLQTTYIYNGLGDVVQTIEKDINTGEERIQKAVYDKRELPIEKIDGSGAVERYTYREDGELIKREQGPWFWEYEYNKGGRISSVTRGMEGSNERHTEAFSYQWQGWDENRAVTKSGEGISIYKVNAFDRITSLTNALGEASTRTVNGAGNTLREQSASGGFYTYRYDASGRLAESSREGEKAAQVRYNSDGTVQEKTDRLGNVTRYAYDGRGLLLKETTALGEVRYTYDSAGRAIRKETISRNGSTYHTEWQYNDSQRTITITNGGTYIETLYLNAWNEVIRRVDGEGNEIKYEYDGAGKMVKSIDGYGRVTSYEWNELGKIRKIDYPDNSFEQYEYNHLGNTKEIKDALGVSWAGEYDEAGRLIKETGRPGINKEYKYDAIGRVLEVKSGGEIVEKYNYTNRGREVVFTDGAGKDFAYQKNAFGEMSGEKNRLGDNQRYVYDAESRPTTSTAWSGKQTKIEYRDNEGITITTYSDGTQITIERDLLGNIIRAANGTGTILYKYDAGGKLVEQTDEGSNEITRYSYDKAGRKVRMQSGNRDVSYRYGNNSELLKVTDNSQRLEVSYEYDVRGRETRRIYGNGVRQETLYDAIGRVILIRETDSIVRMLRAEGYMYDSQGRRSHSVDEEGKVTKYEYDNQSRLSTVLYPWTKEKAEADRIEAEEAGLYFTVEKGTGERYSFSGIEQAALRELLNKASPARGNTVAGSQMVWRESYTYDRNSNRATKTTPWGIIRYEYDAENRLVKKGDIVYNNDKDGNTLNEKGLRYEAKYEYNGQNRMVYSLVTSHVEKTHVENSYGYDALGRRALSNSVTGQTLRTLYDGQSFEVIREGESYRDGSFTTRSSINGLYENRTGTIQSNQITGERYRWVGEGGESSRTRTGDDYTVQNGKYGGRGVTLYGNGEAVAVTYSSSAGGRSRYLGKDLLGSVRSATLDTGALETRYEYDAFGQPYIGDLSSGMNLGYTGKPYDPSMGLYNYGYRDYRPQAARFTTVDPIRDGINWFAYANNDPVNWTDPFGLWVEARNNFYVTTGNLFYSGNNLAASLSGPLSEINGIATQVGVSATMYAGFAIASIFNEDIRKDMDSIGWNPFNMNEDAVIDSNYISFYKGMPVIRADVERSFSFLIIFLNQGKTDLSEEDKELAEKKRREKLKQTLNHEWGHGVQQARLGPDFFLFGIAIPSMIQDPDSLDYFKNPWEKGADEFGRVKNR